VAFQIDENPRISVFIRAEAIAEYPRALIAQIVLAALERRLPSSPLQQNDTEPRRREFLGDDAPACARSDYHRVDVF
jgi:hypothetical protein